MVWKPLASDSLTNEPRLIEESLRGVTKRFGLATPDVLTVVFSKWAEVVGNPLALHAMPIGLHGSVLTVEVDEPAWATEMRFLHDDLVERLNLAAGPGTITEVTVRVRGALRTRQMNGRKRLPQRPASFQNVNDGKGAPIQAKSPEKPPKRT